MKEKPLVSIITPVYNAEKYLETAVNSVLNQTYDNWELILFEDRSTDCSRAIMDKFQDSRIKKYYNTENKGIAFSRNSAIEHSQGEYIAIFDDDVMFKDRLKMQVDFLEKNKGFDVLGGNYEFIDELGNVLQVSEQALYNPRFIKASLLFHNVFCNGEVMFRKSVLDSYQIRYRDNCYGLEDFMFWMELSKVVCFTSVPNVVFQHRMHQYSETRRCVDFERNKRMEKFAEIQRISLEKSGYKLGDKDLQVIKSVLQENRKKKLEIENIKELYSVFEKILTQAKNMQIDYYKELRSLCKKIIGQRIQYTEFLR